MLAQQPLAQQNRVVGLLVRVQRPGCVVQLPVLQESRLNALQLRGGVARRRLLFCLIPSLLATLLLCLLCLLRLLQLFLLQQQEQQRRPALTLRRGPRPLRRVGGAPELGCGLLASIARQR